MAQAKGGLSHGAKADIADTPVATQTVEPIALAKQADQDVAPDIAEAKAGLDHGAKARIADRPVVPQRWDAGKLPPNKKADQYVEPDIAEAKDELDHGAKNTLADSPDASKTTDPIKLAGGGKTAFEPGANSGIRGQNTASYIYRADLYCEECALRIAKRLDEEGKKPANPMDEHSYDSDEYPKGPFFGEESDSPDHCGGCGKFLENQLTQDGYRYLKEMVSEAEAEGRGNEPHILEWKAFYPEAFGEKSKLACAPLGDDRDETLEMEVGFGSLADLGANLPEVTGEDAEAPQQGEGGLNNEPPAKKEAAAKAAASEEAMALAKILIDEGDDLVYDICSNVGQIFDNVKHMTWLQKAVAEEIEAEGILGKGDGIEEPPAYRERDMPVDPDVYLPPLEGE